MTITRPVWNGGVTTRRYDSVGNLIVLTDPDYNTTTWLYNAANQVILQTDPTGAQTVTTYDGDGRLATVTDALGRQKINSYDGNSQLLSQTWKDATNTVVDVQRYTWNSDGTLATAGNNAGMYTFNYDADGRVASITDPNNITLNYIYDAANNVTSITDSRGAVVNSGYNPGNLLTTKSLSGSAVANPLSVVLGYDGNSQLTNINRYNDASQSNLVGSTNNAFDAVGNLTSQTHKNGSGATLASYTNAFDAGNRITSEVRTDSIGSTTTPYSYDAKNEVTSDGVKNYTFDANGNKNNGGSVVGVNNRITTDGTWNFAYDAIGNLISRTNISTGENWTYGFDHNNQLISAVQRNGSGALIQSVAFRYDVFRNLLSETVTPVMGVATVMTFVHDVSNANIGINQQALPIWSQTSSDGTITWFLQDGGGNLLARSGSGIYGTAWLLTDRLGSVREVLSANGTLQDTLKYDAFGNVTTETNSNWTGTRTFTGFYHSVATGILIAQNRPYLPSLNRWLSPDPSGFGPGPNLSEYAGNNGTNATDPSGLADNWHSVGHHYVPAANVKHSRSLLSKGAIEEAAGAYSGATYEAGRKQWWHTYRTYGGVSHAEYSKMVQEEMTAFMKEKGIAQGANGRKMTRPEMIAFIRRVEFGKELADSKRAKDILAFNEEIRKQAAAFEQLVKDGKQRASWRPVTAAQRSTTGQRYLKQNPKRYFLHGAIGSSVVLIGFLNSADAVGAMIEDGSPYLSAMDAANQGDIAGFEKALRGDDTTDPLDKRHFFGFMAQKLGVDGDKALLAWPAYDAAVTKEIESINQSLEYFKNLKD